MICRGLRTPTWRRLAPGAALWLAAFGLLLGLPAPFSSNSEPPALASLTHGHPITALAENSGVRLQKPAQSYRTSFKKPELGGRLARPAAAPSVTSSAQHHQTLWDLPRRHLAAARLIPRSPDDSADPLPS